MAKKLILMLFILCFQNGRAAKSELTVNMYDYCDKIISMMDADTKSIVIYYEHDSGILDRFFKIECTLQISGWVKNDIALQFTSFDMGRSKTTVEVRQGESWKTGEPIDGIPRAFSTFNRLTQVFYTHWWRLFIRVKGKAPPDGVRIFTMVMNVFHGGPCMSGEYECTNGRCIDETLKCNGYNPCGDLSDCQEGLEFQKIAIIVCIIVAVVVLLSFILCKTAAYACNRAKKRQNGLDHDTRDQEDMLPGDTDTGSMAVTYNIVGNTSHTHGPTNNTTYLMSGHVSVFPDEGPGTGDDGVPEQPPSYHSVISSDGDLSSEYESDNSDCDTQHEPINSDNPPPPPDYRTATGETDTTERRRGRRLRRPARRHSSRYLPRYSEVLRHKDAYEVRDNDESVS